MKYRLTLVMLIPILAMSQGSVRLKADTIINSNGVKFYAGQVLHLGKAVGYSYAQMEEGHKYIKSIKQPQAIKIKQITILKIKGVYSSALNNVYAVTKVIIEFNDGSTLKTRFTFNADKAIPSGELIVQ